MARWISALVNAVTIVDSIFAWMREVLRIIYQQPQIGEDAGGLSPDFAHRSHRRDSRNDRLDYGIVAFGAGPALASAVVKIAE